jgi:hypothetical protein
MRYSFEKMIDSGYQVRLNGVFVCYTDQKNSKEVDALLNEQGYESRQEFLDAKFMEGVRSLGYTDGDNAIQRVLNRKEN